MSDLSNDADQAVLQRRRFLRGSALMAAAAGGAVAATAGSVLPASATPVPAYAITLGIPPERVFDTSTGTGQIVDASASALTGKKRLRKGAWIDVVVVPGEEIPVLAVFVNLTSYASLKSGSLVVSSRGDKPTGTTLSHAKGQRVSNSAIVGIWNPVTARRTDDNVVVRIFATATTHVSLDLTGASVVFGDNEPTRTTPEALAKQLAKAARSIHH